MKIASITVYCNEDFRIDLWHQYYEEYESTIFKHIIINNGIESDSKKLAEKFPGSEILYSPSSALTTSYNLGLRYALAQKEIDSILIVGNDMRIEAQSIKDLHSFLFTEESYGMVAPIILKKDSLQIETCCLQIEKKVLKFNHIRTLSQVFIDNDGRIKSDTVPGGMNLARREFYEELGLQDERLVMYADEIDIGLRAQKSNFEFAFNANILSWHQHINRDNANYRPPNSGYQIARNNIYLAKKHFGSRVIVRTFLYQLILSVKIILICLVRFDSKKDMKNRISFFKGNIAGLIN
jgi:GT2 family glycosyltransferase